MPKPKNSKPPYPAAFRQQMVELVAAGRRPSELAKEFGCHETSILSWVKLARAATPWLANLPPTLHESECASASNNCESTIANLVENYPEVKNL